MHKSYKSISTVFPFLSISPQNQQHLDRKMMNVLSITLVLTSLLTSALWSPSTRQHDQQMIVKQGHRAVVVEYHNQPNDRTTKVSISSPNVVNDHNGDAYSDKPEQRMFAGPRDLLCEAYGNCKNKISHAVRKTVTKTEDTIGPIGESLSHGIDKAKKVAKDTKETVQVGVSKDFDVVDSPKRLGEDITRNVTGRVAERVKGVHKSGPKSASEILSKVKELVDDVVGYMNIGSVVNLIRMLGFSTAYGMCVWVTFVSSYILGGYLPRQVFGMVQSRIYPVYFKAMSYCVSGALFGHLVSQKGEILRNKMAMFQGFSLLSALFMVLTNMILLEPKATEAMYERMKMEKEEGKKVVLPGKDGSVDSSRAAVLRSAARVVAERQNSMRLNEKLKRLNAYSCALNLGTLVTLTWHMAYMGQQLQVRGCKY